MIEDEPMVGLDVVAALEGVSAEVDGPIGTAEKACEIIEQSRADEAILDANLHGRPVDVIARALTRRNIAFVFLSGYGRAGLPQDFQAAPLLSKPASHQQIIDAALELVTERPNVVRSSR